MAALLAPPDLLFAIDDGPTDDDSVGGAAVRGPSVGGAAVARGLVRLAGTIGMPRPFAIGSSRTARLGHGPEPLAILAPQRLGELVQRTEVALVDGFDDAHEDAGICPVSGRMRGLRGEERALLKIGL